MKDITVHIKVERYIKEWLTFHLGNPVRFPERSYENEVIHRHLSRRPMTVLPELPGEDMVAIVITDCRYRKPEHYNYLGRDGQRAVASAINGLFKIQLWAECFPLMYAKGELNKGIDKWCADNGISLDAREAVRQKFYRLRKLYLQKGIVLHKIYRKKSATLSAENEQLPKTGSHG
jgi:hypothetical protein